ncbi:hypothetical protein EJ076_04170 [Mesorhizobium sp. M7D.F.Ca.US.005.01.1.1]|nr:hypothetical protein EJ076_04170 [Mesorhizobium sp. M7D.F.Ca.US.005.01.1.1]RUX97657.1 hypothetical protein EN993_02660 [Mesorhizobium sp. M7D.F.Ca.US.004.01.2.1]RVA33950.1 hypothetical protein EN935_07945 [Mesorhizobium sp. M7D.F.Ca.US.004.03.1.1]
MVTRGAAPRLLCNRIGQPAGFDDQLAGLAPLSFVPGTSFPKIATPSGQPVNMLLGDAHYLLAVRTSFGFTATRSWRP